MQGAVALADFDETPRPPERRRRIAPGGWSSASYSVLVLAILLVPIVYTIVFSFNDARRTNIVWRGFTFDNWLNVCDDAAGVRVVRHEHPTSASRRRVAATALGNRDRDRPGALHASGSARS